MRDSSFYLKQNVDPKE